MAPEKPAHARRIAELEQRVDDLEGEVEKISRNVRVWLGRVAKREARAAQEALQAPVSDEQQEAGEGTALTGVNRLDKAQLRLALARGQVRKMGA